MKRHIAILATGALIIVTGLVLAVETADNAYAAENPYRPQVNRTQVNRPQLKRPKTINRPQITNRPQLNRPQATHRHRLNRPQVTNRPPLNRPQITNRPVGIPTAKPNMNRPNLNRPVGIIKAGPRRPQGPLVNVISPRPRGPNVTLINNSPYTIFRGPRRIWWNGTTRTLVALTVLGGIYVGSTYLIADGYVPLAAPVCSGVTAEGCSLVWRDVPTEDGA